MKALSTSLLDQAGNGGTFNTALQAHITTSDAFTEWVFSDVITQESVQHRFYGVHWDTMIFH